MGRGVVAAVSILGSTRLQSTALPHAGSRGVLLRGLFCFYYRNATGSLRWKRNLRPRAPCDSVRWIVVDWTLHTNVLAVDWDEKGNELNNATPTRPHVRVRLMSPYHYPYSPSQPPESQLICPAGRAPGPGRFHDVPDGVPGLVRRRVRYYVSHPPHLCVCSESMCRVRVWGGHWRGRPEG